MSENNKHLVSLVGTGLFCALAVVLSRFLSVNLWNMSIGFSFVPLLFCGMLFGPLWGGVCAALADLIGALLFPFGPYFPGFTAVALLSGIIFGLVGFAAEKMKNILSFAAVCTLLICFKEAFCSLFVNSYWITLLYGSDYKAVFLSRLPLSVITVILEILFALIVRTAILPTIKKAMEK